MKYEKMQLEADGRREWEESEMLKKALETSFLPRDLVIKDFEERRKIQQVGTFYIFACLSAVVY